jgi:FkbM family methyltransferase
MIAAMERLGFGAVKSSTIGRHNFCYLVNGGGWRFETLLEKEPETIEWIDSFRPNETLWDIGANVGIYSIYAAMLGIKVIAFEPHFANYFQLCVNIMLNVLQDKVTPLCVAFAAQKAVRTISLASLDFGSSMSSFGCDLDFRGKPFVPAFRQGMIGYDIDSFVADFNIPAPTHFKIDVDGIELDIIKGGKKTFAQNGVKSVSIELVDTDQAQVDGVTEILAGASLDFTHKKSNIEFASPQTKDVMNFLYRRAERKAWYWRLFKNS